MEHRIIATHERPHGNGGRGIRLCVQVHQIECSCGWKSSWVMDTTGPLGEFEVHAATDK